MSKLVVKEYDCVLSENNAGMIRIAFLSDLHGASYKNKKGEDRVVNAVVKSGPDIVIAGGDMLIGFKDCKDEAKAKTEPSVSMLTKLSKNYPVYHALGNHELKLPENILSGYLDKLRAVGVKILDNAYEDINLSDGKVLRLYGLSLPCEYYPKIKSKTLSVSVIERALKTNRVSGNIKDVDIRLLLAHNPNYADTYEEFGADITLSGHIHGGVVRAFNRGLIGPDFKLFPMFSGGSYKGDRMNLFVSCGLGEHVVPFRVNNPYEITVINVYY